MFHRAEALLGLVIASFLAFAAMVGGPTWVAQGAIYQRPRWPVSLTVVASVGVLLVVLCIWRSVAELARGVESDDDPISVHVARRQLGWRVVLRPFVGLWWALLAAAVVGLTEVLISGYKFLNPTAAEQVIAIFVKTVLMFAAAFACNSFLLCATGALLNSDAAIGWMWRGRILIDLAIALLVPNLRGL